MEKSHHARKYKTLLVELQKARRQAGLTQLDVAKRLGTYTSYVSKCESGERRLDAIEIAELCKVYGVRMSRLMKSIGVK